LNFSESIW